MCGIAGKLAFHSGATPSQELITHMCDAIAHRGPNDAGYYRNGPIALGHRRLSIIDLASGHQPLSNEDDTVWVVFNGEIYNFVELREGLEAKGHQFRTKSSPRSSYKWTMTSVSDVVRNRCPLASNSSRNSTKL